MLCSVGRRERGRLVRVSELEGAALDYWVARAEGYEYVDVPPDASGENAGRALLPPGLLASGWTFPPKGAVGDMIPKFSADWALGGPIIERERISLSVPDRSPWIAIKAGKPWAVCPGATPLIAAMRAYVASKFGDDVQDLP